MIPLYSINIFSNRSAFCILHYACLILIALFFHSTSAFSQAPDWRWAVSMGSQDTDYGNSITTDASGNVYSTGGFSGVIDFDPGPGQSYIFAYAANDIFVTKFSRDGNFIWARAMGHVVDDEGYSIAVDASGNVYTTGVFAHTVDFDPSGITSYNISSVNYSPDVFISKLDSNGNFVWAKAMGGSDNDIGYGIALDDSGNVYTAGAFSGTADFDPGSGNFNLTASGYNDVFISKLDSDGNFIWAKSMGGPQYAWAQGICVDPTGVYTTGHFSDSADFDPGVGQFNLQSVGNNDIFVSKLNTSGNFVWAKAMGGTSDDDSHSIAVYGENIYTCGLFSSTADFDPGAGIFNLTSVGSPDIFISKLDFNGNFIWAKSMGGPEYSEARSIAVDVSGNVYTTGIFTGTTDFDPGVGTHALTSVGGNDLYVSKLDASGNFQWAKTSGGTLDDAALSVAVANSGKVNMTGYFSSPSISLGSFTFFNTNMDTTFVTNDLLIAQLDTILITEVNATQSENPAFSLFPNPAATQLFVIGNQLSLNTIEVYNVLGENVLSIDPRLSNYNEVFHIDISSLKPGIFSIRLVTEEKIYSRKFVKK
jgi:hypothetical protein